MATRSKSSQQVRLQVAQLAARLLADDGMTDYFAAKRKAAQRLGIHNQRQLPSNQEIEQAIIDYQRLFRADTQPQQLRQMRMTALAAMEFLAPYRPRLAGPVADGTAGEHGEVTLHVYNDAVEEIAIHLLDNQIPHAVCERRVRLNPALTSSFPALKFLADSHTIVLIILPLKARNQPPLSMIDGSPMQRLDQRQLQALLDATDHQDQAR